MTYLAILLGCACVAVTTYELRRAYRRGYEAGLKRARAEAWARVQYHYTLSPDGVFREGVYAGALDVSDCINALRYEDRP